MAYRTLTEAFLAAAALAVAGAPTTTTLAAAQDSGGVQVVELSVTSKGFVPAVVTVKNGKPVKLVVTRKTERTCATEIVMKDFGVNQALPSGKAVTVMVSPKGPGQYRFACGMDMVAGVLKVQ
jgi:plastocyanin domain-containing protein